MVSATMAPGKLFYPTVCNVISNCDSITRPRFSLLLLRLQPIYHMERMYA